MAGAQVEVAVLAEQAPALVEQRVLGGDAHVALALQGAGTVVEAGGLDLEAGGLAIDQAILAVVQRTAQVEA
ncbi:hypothetical protein D3C77_666400 [compost metagenome]